jgi:hypothetical protein
MTGKVDTISNGPNTTISLDGGNAKITVGASGVNGTVVLLDSSQTTRITLQGSTGDILFGNADCAEDFDVAEEAPPGAVMVLDGEGRLRQSRQPYDRRVAGVISGAGDFRPALVLDKRPGEAGRRPIALLGKVFCHVDASYGAIEPGDLLTTSPTPGHAMKAGDPHRLCGAILGKALRQLPAGQGLVPILVTLQ